MGGGHWSTDAYADLSATYSTKSADTIFSKGLKSDMSPMNLGVRESRDSDEHPESLAVMVWLDVTGSMGRIPEDIIKNELGTLMDTIIKNGIKHPQILFGAIGDHISDSVPLQVSQFESGTEQIDKWLTSIFLEGCGGGQAKESYLQAWLVAGRHTSIDCFERRNQKGFLFTIGDEMSWESINTSDLKSILGYTTESDVTDKQLLEEAQRTYNVYHIHVNEGSYKNDSRVLGYWKDILGERLIILDDYHSICAVISTIIAVQHGVDMSTVVKGFDDKTAAMVINALATVETSAIVGVGDEGIMKL
jgi:hypothetical protein